MYGRFVGLDRGKKDVRVSLINRGLRDVQLLQTIRVSANGHTDGPDDPVGRVFKEYSLPKGDVAASLPGDPVSVRVMRFPFSDPKKIDQVYEFELENISTFDPKDKIHSYHLVKSSPGGEALVCVFEKSDVEHTLGLVNEAGVDPKVLTYTPLAFGALNEIIEGQRPLMLVDMGDSELSFALFDESGLKRVRSSTKPVELLLENLGEYGPGKEDEFGFAKEKLATIGGDRLRECLAPVVSDMKKTVQFFENELKDRIKTILVSGPLSQLPGLTDLMKREFGREVKKLFIPDLGVDNSPLYAKSYALALYGSTYRSGYLNFRKDNFKYMGVDRELRRVFMAPAVLFAILVVLLIYNVASKYFELKGEVNALEAKISEVVRDTFPEVRVIPRPAEFMEAEVAKVRDRLGRIEGVEGGSTPLEILRKLSGSLPAGMSLTVNDVKFESDNELKIQGVCDSYQEVAEIEEALSKSGVFESVTRNQTGNTVNGKTKFEISLVVKRQA